MYNTWWGVYVLCGSWYIFECEIWLGVDIWGIRCIYMGCLYNICLSSSGVRGGYGGVAYVIQWAWVVWEAPDVG